MNEMNSGSSSSPQGGFNLSDCATCCDWEGISKRVQEVLKDPVGVWAPIKAESKSIKEIYISYLIPLSVIGALCTLLGSIIFAGSSIFSTLIFQVVTLALGLGMFLVFAYILKFLAGQFDAKPSETDTFKLIAYSSTASLVGHFLTIFPPLAIVSILFGIYSLYTLYQGIPTMTGVTEKRIPYFLVSIVAWIIVNVVIMGAVVGTLGLAVVGTAAVAG